MHYGVLYPLQSFSPSRALDWQTLPLFIMANADDALQALQTLASKLSGPVVTVPAGDLVRLHTAGVFANNFVNYLLSVAKDLAGEQFHLLYPLVRETLEKAFAAVHPKDVQTGPAVRNDTGTMVKQLAILPLELQPLYQQISALIAGRQLTVGSSRNFKP
jgi:predicted short-subunit dehydrogenase-like oxidoreductase (DUF2520 family)